MLRRKARKKKKDTEENVFDLVDKLAMKKHLGFQDAESEHPENQTLLSHERIQEKASIHAQEESLMTTELNLDSEIVRTETNPIQIDVTKQIQPEEGFLRTGENTLVGTSIVIGKRSSQQDALAVSSYDVNTEGSAWLGVLCDGMGGLSGGEAASSLCVNKTISRFKNETANSLSDVPLFYRNLISSLDNDVYALTDAEGRRLGAGTTFVSVMILSDGLYWASVGDSHIYIVRNNQIKMVVEEHNYLRDLLAMVARGDITEEEAYSDKSKEALTSYIGIGGVPLMSISNTFRVQPGDIAILCSDGLYRALSEAEIHHVVLQHYDDMQAAADALTSFALMKNYPYQDNTSVILVKYP